MSFLHGAILSLTVGSSIFTPALELTKARAPIEQAELKDLMTFACSVMNYDCSGIAPPQAIYEPMFYSYGYWGAFDPTRPEVILIDSQISPFLDPIFVRSVVAHELTHYVEWHLGHDFTEPRCQIESNGWRVGNAYLVANDRGDLADFNWHIRYGCYQ